MALEVFGNYGYTCANNVLLKTIDGEVNQSISNMNNKRFIIYREPDSTTKKLNAGTLKELTGGNKINARGIYSSNTDVNLKATHILECNDRPKISNENIDNALIQRIIDLEFRSTFTKIRSQINEENYIFEGDDNVKEKSFQEKYKFAFFNILIEYWTEYKNNDKNIDYFITDNIRIRSEEYLKNSNELFSWFDENYEKTDDDKDIIKLSDVYEEFKISDIYINYSKQEKREYNKTKFIDKISKNIFLRRYYKETEKRKDVMEKFNLSKIHNILTNYKIRI